MFQFGKRRILLIGLGAITIVGGVIAVVTTRSCASRQTEDQALAQLRSSTRNGALPADTVMARIEAEHPNTKVAGLARIVRARIRLAQNDQAGAAAMLDNRGILQNTSVGDYALWMRGNALEKANQSDQARSVYEQLNHDYPNSLKVRDSILREGNILAQSGRANLVPDAVRALTDRDDGAALLLAAKAFEQNGDSTRALGAYRRIYFYASASPEAAEAETAMGRLSSPTVAGSAEEAITRAERLYDGKRFKDASDAYTDAFTRFPGTITPAAQLRRGIALSIQKRTPDAVAALNQIPASAGETRAQALYYAVQAYANARQWDGARSTLDSMRTASPQSSWTVRAYLLAGAAARDANNSASETLFFRTALSAYPQAIEVAQAQFELAWMTHDSKNYAESSRLLTEHLAYYANRNTDNRGKAGYWAARDSERAGKLAEARALYEAMQVRYGANWYGYLAQQRLEIMNRGSQGRSGGFAPDSVIGRAIANLKTVTIAQESAGQAEMERVGRADQLAITGIDDWAFDELNAAGKTAPTSPKINFALARIYRSRNDNVQAFNMLKRSYPDYAQMKVEEMAPEEWDIFYPLNYWEHIALWAKNRGLDPYQVAGMIRTESVFNPRAKSGANAYGLMQLLVPTARFTAKKNGVDDTITAESLYQPALNIQLGTAYFREQLDKFGKLEYVAIAYNAGPGRVPQWRASLPLEMDEFSEAIPIKETRLYVQGVIRNWLQYRRLYGEDGKFRPEVGARSLRAALDAAPNSTPTDPDVLVRPLEETEAE
jgi:soluble lytic murein transglycosylase